MESSPVVRTRFTWQSWTLMVLVALITLAPWWRNHHYLRDFYDYGLVMSGVGRIEAGERPFVDFVTPIQSGTFLFNGWAEKLGDGTYQAMTWGAAALVVLGMTVLAGIFLRCWPAGTAVAMAGAMACMTVAQHTIIWHNCVGAICIAVAACTAAVAPVWRRSQWAWHGLTVVALVIGGITKLNAHLVAVCGVLAWALLHGFTRKADWSRVGATVIGLAICGLLIPVGLELAWTHASPGALWYNVVALPFSGRTGDLTAALHWKFYFSTRHDYYGLLPVPQLGAVGVAVTAAFVVAGIRALGWRQGGWVIAAALFAAASGAGLLATNYEIAYVAMGAWFALVASLWLGFGLRCSGRLFYGGLFFPALAVGAIAWQSAWQGQRSQFGYSQAPRTDYVAGENIAPDFAYLRDTFVPPEISASMSGAARWRAGLSAEEKAAVYYGPGLEWLQRPWPALKIPGLPLWLHGGTSYGAVEEARLLDAFAPAGPYRHVLVPEARDVWGPVITPELAEKYILRRVGPAWFRYDKQPPGVVSWQPLEFLRAFGGNVNSTQLISFELKLQTLFAGRSFLGVDHGAGEMMLTAPSNRAQGEAVVCRVPGKTAPVAAKVRFEVFSVAGGNYYPRWSAEVNLPEAQSEIIVPFPVDCGGSPLRFLVTVPPELAGRVVAGWRDLNVLHSVDGPEVPPMLQMWARDAEPANAAMRAAVLPADWNPSAMYVRNARLGPRGLELLPGGEIWIKLAGIFVGINGVASVAEGVGMPVDPVMHVLYCKGAKLDVVAESAIRDPGRRFEFKARSAERDGWLVFRIDAQDGVPPVLVRIDSVKVAD